jgi:hypothetical protein
MEVVGGDCAKVSKQRLIQPYVFLHWFDIDITKLIMRSALLYVLVCSFFNNNNLLSLTKTIRAMQMATPDDVSVSSALVPDYLNNSYQEKMSIKKVFDNCNFEHSIYLIKIMQIFHTPFKNIGGQHIRLYHQCKFASCHQRQTASSLKQGTKQCVLNDRHA